MPLVRPKAFLEEAKKNKKGIGAFNVLSQEMIKAIVQAAEETNTPVMMQISTSAMRWAQFEIIVPAALSAARNSKVDIAVHLDHSQDIDLIKRAVDAGFPSVMYDGSHFSLEENISKTKEVIEYCKGKADVEIEIGKVGGKEGDIEADESDLLTPKDAIDFYEKTKPDLLAVAFGTAHGVYKGEINLDYKLIEEVAKVISVPLVMHGTSGVPSEMIKKSIAAGITKVNVGTDLLIVNNKAIRKYMLENPKAYDIRKINTPGIIAMKERAIEYINIFNNN